MLLSVADQGLASGGHFALNILLIRSLSPSEYGAFAVTFASLLLVASLQNALILEPMGVIGPAQYGERLSAYLRTILWMHWGLSLTIAVAALIVAAGLAAVRNPLFPAVLGLGISVPFILLLWLLRRACYLRTNPDVAFQGSLVYLLLLIAGMAGLWRYGLVSAGSAFLLMGAAAGAVSGVLWRRLGARPEKVIGAPASPGVAEVIRHHWAYARWSLGTTVLYWLANSIYLPVVGVLAGLPAVAAYRATENLLHPMSQTLTALGMLLLPWVAGQCQARDRGYLRRTAFQTSLLAGLPAATYVLGMVAAGPGLSRLIYGNEFYVSATSLIPWMGASLVLRTIGDTGFGVAARAAGWPDLGFWATLASAAVTLTAGIWLVSRFGAAGAAAGWTASSAVSCVVSVHLFRLRLK